MPLRLPSLSSIDLSASTRELAPVLAEHMEASQFEQGYFRVDVMAAATLLFARKGKTYCAGLLRSGQAMGIPVADFLARGRVAERVTFCGADLPLFLCTAVLVRKAPATQIPSEKLKSSTLKRHLQTTGKDAVLVIRAGEARSVAFCREGTPVKLYTATGEQFPEAASVLDQIVAYAKGAGGEVFLDVYDEINLGPTQDAGQPLAELSFEPALAPTQVPVLAIKLGERVVFHHAMRKPEVRIGRGLSNDLALDNPSVSRNHAVLRREGDTLIADDLGSQNGLYQRNKQVASARLAPGDEVGIGKYTLTYLKEAPEALVSAQPRHFRSPLAAMERTYTIVGQDPPRLVAASGSSFALRMITITIGRHEDADIPIKGRQIADEHARINRSPDGGFFVCHVDGRQPLKVNGKAVKEAMLHNGDVIEIGKNRFTYVKI